MSGRVCRRDRDRQRDRNLIHKYDGSGVGWNDDDDAMLLVTIYCELATVTVNKEKKFCRILKILLRVILY